MYKSVFSGSENRGGREATGRPSFGETLQRGGCCKSRGGGRASGQSPAFTVDRAQAQRLSSLLRTFVDLLRALSDRFEQGGKGGGGGTPMPVEPDGGIGDGAGPPPFAGGGDNPPEATTLAIGEEDGGGGFPQPIIVDGEERFPVEPDGGIGDGAGPPPFAGGGDNPPEATTLAIGEEDGGGGFPQPIFVDGEQRFPVEPDGGIGDGAGPIPFPEGGETPIEPDGDPGNGPVPIIVDGREVFPVEPDGGIGDGAGPPPFAVGGGGGPVGPGDLRSLLGGGTDPRGPDRLINVQDLPGPIDTGGIGPGPIPDDRGTPIEPAGDPGNGPTPLIVDGREVFPVEPDGGIGDGAGPPPFASGDDDGATVDPGSFPTDPDDLRPLSGGGTDPCGPDFLINVQQVPGSIDTGGGRGGIPFEDIARYGRRND